MNYIYINDTTNGGQKIFQSTGANDEQIIKQAQAALPAIGGTLYFVGTFTLGNTANINQSNVNWQGLGESTVIKMANGINKDLVYIGTGGAVQLQNVSIRDMTLDGNSANNSLGNGVNTNALVRGYFQNVLIQNIAQAAFIFSGQGGSLDSFWNTVFKCRVQSVGQFVQEITSHENFYNNNIFIDHGAGFYGFDFQTGWSFLYANKFQRFNAPANTKALISLGCNNPVQIVGNQFNGSPQEILRITGNNHVITGNHFRNAGNSLANTYPSIYLSGQNNTITSNIFINDVSTPVADVKEVTGAENNILTPNQLDKGIIEVGTASIVPNQNRSIGQSIINYKTGNGWLFNSIDTQVITKSNGWNPGASEITLELNAIKALGINYVAHAIPYDNTAKWALWMPLIRAAGLKAFHRSHWNAWEGDNGASANLSWAAYKSQTTTFINSNPTFFQDGDLFGMTVEAQQVDGKGNTAYPFRVGNVVGGAFDYAQYNQALKDQITVSNAAFAAIGKQIMTFPISFGVSNLNLAGQTLDSGDTGNNNGLADADIVANFNSILTIDHYLLNTYRSSDNYGAKYSSDLDKIHTAFPSCKLFITEWGYPTNAVLSDSEQFLVYQQVVDVLLTKPYIIGVNFWDHHGGTTESLFNDNNGTIVTPGRKAVIYVNYAFNTKNAAI